MVNYLLLVLTHGDGETLEACLDSFAKHVEPAPTRLAVLRDGPGSSYVPSWGLPVSCEQIAEAPVGFCAATAAAWRAGADGEMPFVFYLEHDFVFTRDLDLLGPARVLETDRQVAQMALCRGPCNERERAAGGLVASRPGEFEPVETEFELERPGQPGKFSHYTYLWLRHRSYFSTNPSLMRRWFMADNPFIVGEPGCEGRYGFRLRDAGYSFGLWGDGTPWVDHVGVRSGFGY